MMQGIDLVCGYKIKHLSNIIISNVMVGYK